MNSGTHSRMKKGYVNESWGIDHSFSQMIDPYYAKGVDEAKHDAHVIKSGIYQGIGCQLTLPLDQL